MATSIKQWNDARRRRRRAGARARRKYADLRRKWLRRNRKLWLAAAAVCVIFWLVFDWLLDTLPGDHTWTSGAFAGALFATLIAFRQSPPVSIASWEEGAYGEEETAKQLRILEKDGSNFDHIALGPTGVYCLNSKWSGYRLEVNDEGRLVGRHRYDDDLNIDRNLRTVRGEAAALSKQIERRCGQRIVCSPSSSGGATSPTAASSSTGSASFRARTWLAGCGSRRDALSPSSTASGPSFGWADTHVDGRHR